MENLIGQSLGRYHILEQLGEGGMATVYKAYDTRLERDVAVKIIRRNAFPPEQIERILKRFEREAKSLAKLSHPNIVGVIDYGEHEGAPYLVLEYLPGGTLKERMKGQPMPWQEAVRLLTPIAGALDYAHDQKIIHRDVKPANILLTVKGQPMLSDFGIAKILEMEDGHTLTGTGMGVGTPEYMAPEQGMGREVDGRADIYSLGIIFYELITGRKPYTADTPMAVILKHMTDPLPRPSHFIPALPEAVERVLIKALAKDPAERYSDSGVFAAALENLINGTQLPTIEVKANHPNTKEDTSETVDSFAVSGLTPPKGITRQSPSRQEAPVTVSKKSATANNRYLLIGLGILSLVIISIWVGSILRPAASETPPPTEQAAPTEALPSTDVPIQAPSAAPNEIPATIEAPAVDPLLENCSKEEIFCVGLVTDVGKVNDKSFNQSAWEGLQKSKSDGTANLVQFIETVDAKDYAKNIATFGDAGFDVIVTVGFALNEATAAAAITYPDIKFIGVDQFQAWPYTTDTSDDIANLAGLNFPEDNGGFLVGALAAMMSKSHVIGAVCGTDVVPPVWRFGEGYKAGATYADSLNGTTTEVQVVYHSDVGFDKTFTDPEWGAQTAKALMDNSADVIFGCGGQTGNGAVIAAAQAGAYAIGVDTDQYLTLPEAARGMLSSALKLIGPGVGDLISAAKVGTIEAGNFIGDAGYAPYHDLDSMVSADIKNAMEKIDAGLRDGSIKTNVPPAKP
jgi:basic membrane protein A